MPGPEQLIRAAVALPVAIVRIAWGLLPGTRGDGDPPRDDVEIRVAADDAMTRERAPVEVAALVADDDGAGHVESEVEVVAESADPDATETVGPEIRIED